MVIRGGANRIKGVLFPLAIRHPGYFLSGCCHPPSGLFFLVLPSAVPGPVVPWLCPVFFVIPRKSRLPITIPAIFGVLRLFFGCCHSPSQRRDGMARWGGNPRDISGVTPRPTGHSDSGGVSARLAAARCCARVCLMAVPVAVMPQANARPQPLAMT